MHLDFKISFNFTEFWYFTDNENMNVLFTVTGLPHLLISIIHKWISTFDFFFMPDQCCNRTNRKVVLLHSKHFYFIWYLNLKNENVLWTVTGLPWNCPLLAPTGHWYFSFPRQKKKKNHFLKWWIWKVMFWYYFAFCIDCSKCPMLLPCSCLVDTSTFPSKNLIHLANVTSVPPHFPAWTHKQSW